MEIDKLYHVDKKNLNILDQLLTACFVEDPLYKQLIPDSEIRKKLLPELFSCDLEEFFDTCEVYADSKDLNGIVIVSEHTKFSRLIKYFIYEFFAQIKTDGYLVKEDPSLKTLWNFIKGKDYLNSKWTEEIQENKRLHIIYLAVNPALQHHGIASYLVQAILGYSEQNRLTVSLETHNPHNIPFYQEMGFKLFEVMEKNFDLKQYCMIYTPRSNHLVQA